MCMLTDTLLELWFCSVCFESGVVRVVIKFNVFLWAFKQNSIRSILFCLILEFPYFVGFPFVSLVFSFFDDLGFCFFLFLFSSLSTLEICF